MSDFKIIRTTNTKLIKKLDKTIFPDDNPVEISKGIYWWIAIDTSSNTPVAYAGSYHMISYAIKKSVLHRAGVLSKYRGHGLQRRLIKVRERFAKKEKCKEIVTYTSYDNIHSSNNLIKCGFVLYKPQYPWVWGAVNYWKRKI